MPTNIPTPPPPPFFIRVDRRLRCSLFTFHELKDQWRENELHGQIELAAGNDDGVRAPHETVVDHGKQIAEIQSPRTSKPDNNPRFLPCRYQSTYHRTRATDGPSTSR